MIFQLIVITFLTEADVAFLSPPPFIRGNQVFHETWDGGVCARAAFVLVDGLTYKTLVCILKTISLHYVGKNIFGDFEDQRIRKFTTGMKTKCVEKSTSEEKILDEAICIASELFGHKFQTLNDWCWYGSFIKVLDEHHFSRHLFKIEQEPTEGCLDHVSLAKKASPEDGVVHVLEGEKLYKEPRSVWCQGALAL